jgi:hypothetical protein
MGISAASLETVLRGGGDLSALLRGVNILRNDVLAVLGAEPSEWDLLSPVTGGLSGADRLRLPMSAYLEDIRSDRKSVV